MRAFKVYVNGKRLCLAGIGDNGVLTANVVWVTGRGGADQFLEVGGLVGATDENVRWAKRKPLRVGDQIQIKLVDATAVDKPIERQRTDPKERLKAEKKYVRITAKKFGWKIQVRPKRSVSSLT
jgi:hypothetical protein